MTEERNSKRISLFPLLPEDVSEVLERLSGRAVNQYEIIGLIENNQVMTEGLLKMLNKAMFGETKLNSLTDLVDMLGLPRMRYAVLAYGLNRFCTDTYLTHAHTTGLSAKITWEHAIAVAYIALELAKKIKYPRLEEVLLAGLIHDIGRQIIMLNRPEEYGELLGSIYGEVVDIIAQERTKLGLSHEHVGVMLVGHWHLPESISDVIEYHHNAETTSDNQILVHLVSLANQIAVSEGTSFEQGEKVNKDSNVSLYFLGLNGEDIDGAILSFHQNIGKFKSVFQ
ncbi:MAG: HDOD domain-containing protein [Acidobacteria bacterium]|nr:HDOD domain-containing protein [Acidobacteriota bacterium]